MTNVLTMTPLLRRSVGFDRFNDLFDTFFDEKSAAQQDHYPPHNIEKYGENLYRITMAVAGFKEADLNIVQNDNTLTVTGDMQAHNKDNDAVEYLYRGIASRAFERSFRLDDHIKVNGANLKDGLLMIDLEREIPEEKKPKMIKIKAETGKLSHDKK